MVAEKIVKINPEHEVEYLKNKLQVYEDSIEFSVAETILRLRDKVRELEDEAIALRVSDSEKDKMIAEKETRIAEIKKNFDTQLANKLEWQRKQFELEKKQSLMDQRKNIRQKEVKPKEEIVEQAQQEVDRIREMHESLLREFSKVNEKLDTQTELLYKIIDIISNSDNIDEAKDEIDEVMMETKNALGIEYKNNRKPSKKEKEEFTLLVGTLSKTMSNKEIAIKLYNDKHPFLTTVDTESGREQKVGRYLKKYRKDME